MSFGFSAGDIAQCIKLLVRIGKAIKDSDDSAAEYQSAVKFLEGVERTVQVVEGLLHNHQDLTYRNDLETLAIQLVTTVTQFREKTEGYETSLGVNPTTSWAKKARKRVQLNLFGDIDQLKSDVSYPQSNLNDLICVQVL